jgi:hypothetical protein
MEKAGYKIPLCDFRVKGVTSISADTHKVCCNYKSIDICSCMNLVMVICIKIINSYVGVVVVVIVW